MKRARGRLDMLKTALRGVPLLFLFIGNSDNGNLGVYHFDTLNGV